LISTVRATAAGVTDCPSDVLAAGRKATGVRGAGFIDTVNQRITLQTEGQSVTPCGRTWMRIERTSPP
jgi:hypothetical protein